MLKQLPIASLQNIVSPHTESNLQGVAGLCLSKNQKYKTGAKLLLMITSALHSVPEIRPPASFPLIRKESLNKASDDLYF